MQRKSIIGLCQAPLSSSAYGSVKRIEPNIMCACAVDGVPGATYQGARVR